MRHEKVVKFITELHLRRQGLKFLQYKPRDGMSAFACDLFAGNPTHQEFDEIQFEININNSLSHPNVKEVFLGWDDFSGLSDFATRPIKSFYVKCYSSARHLANGALVETLLNYWQSKFFTVGTHELHHGHPTLVVSHLNYPFPGRIAIFCFYTWQCANSVDFKNSIPKYNSTYGRMMRR